MKHVLSALLILVGFSVAAEKKDNYNFSVFSTQNAKATSESRTVSIEKFKAHFPGAYFNTDKFSGQVNDIFGRTWQIPGNTMADKAIYCISNLLEGVTPGEWQVKRNFEAPNAGFIDYTQYIQGHKVLFSRIGFRFTKTGELQRTMIRQYGKSRVSALPVLTAGQAENVNTLTEGLDGTRAISTKAATDWDWFPVPAAGGYTLHPAWEVNIDAMADNGMPLMLQCYIDGIDGKLLYRSNQVRNAFDVTVNASVYKNTPLTPATLEPLNNLLMVVNSNNYYTNTSGFLSIPSLTSLTAYFVLAGKWVNVLDVSNTYTPNFSAFFSGIGNSYTFPNTPPASNSRLVNAYYHTDRIHDHMRKYFPAFTDLDQPLQANVDDPSGNCNAFYNGSSINFFAEANGCASFAEVGDIIYHEYGHAINSTFYTSNGSTTMINGAMHEGYADVWAMSLNERAVLGEGAYLVPGGGFIRRYDRLAKMYPTDIIGEVHADGEIIAGAWWDLAENINSVDTMTILFTKDYFDLNDGPDGTEGQLYYDILVSTILNDDNDGTLANGTPHFAAIANAFARHGIYLYGDATFAHTELKHQSYKSDATVTAYLNVTNPSGLTGLILKYRERGNTGWQSAQMSPGSGFIYTAPIPKQKAGTIIDYYFQATTTAAIPHGIFPLNYDAAMPRTEVTLPYQFGFGLLAKDSNSFETNANGWTIGNVQGDDATSGIWIRTMPLGSATPAGYVCQPNYDHTTGNGKCLITGNAPTLGSDIGVEDVDNGITTVLSPVYDISSFQKPVIEYYRWYSNSRGGNAGNDAWQVQITDTSNKVWYTVDSTYQPDYNWRRRIFAVLEFMPIAKNLQIKFTAADILTNDAQSNGQSVVEAGIDDVIIYDEEPVGISQLPGRIKVEIFPNPADETINISTPTELTGIATLYTINGQVVHSVQMVKGKTKYSVDTRSLSAGQYTIVITTEGQIQSSKVIIRHK